MGDFNNSPLLVKGGWGDLVFAKINMINKILVIIFVSTSLLVFSGVNTILSYDFAGDSGLDKTAAGTGHATGDGEEQLTQKIGDIVQAVLSFLGVIFLVLMIYGGYLWMTARGNEEQVTKAKNLITAAIIGLIIVISAYAISYFIIKSLSDTTLLE